MPPEHEFCLDHLVGFVFVLDPDMLIAQVDLGVAPTWPDFLLGIAVGMVELQMKITRPL